MKVTEEEALVFRSKITEEFKKQIVFEILAGKTFQEVQAEYRAPSVWQLIAWVRIYSRKINMRQVKLPALTDKQKSNMKEVKLRAQEIEKSLEEAELKILALIR